MDVIKRHTIHYELYEYDNKYYYGEPCEHLNYIEFTFKDIIVNVPTTELIFKYSDYLNIKSFEKIYSFTSFEYNNYLFSLDFNLPLNDFIIKLEWYNYIIFQYNNDDVIKKVIYHILYYLFKLIDKSNITTHLFDKILTLLPEQLHYYVTHYYFAFYVLKLNINKIIIKYYLQYKINLYCVIKPRLLDNLFTNNNTIDEIIYNETIFNIPMTYNLIILKKINEYNLISFMKYLKDTINNDTSLIISTIIHKNFNLFKVLVNETNVNMDLDNNYTSILHLMTYNVPNQCHQYTEWIDYIVNTLNADCTLYDDKYESILQLACRHNRIYMLQLLLSKLDDDINYYGRHAINDALYHVTRKEVYDLLKKYGICNIQFFSTKHYYYTT